MAEWSTPESITARMRSRWADGSLLTAHLRGQTCPVLDVPLRGPSAGQISSDLAAVREWARRLERGGAGGAAYRLVHKEIGGRSVGRNALPARAVVESFPQAWRLLGVRDEVHQAEGILAVTREHLPAAGDWVAGRALRLLPMAGDWPRIVAAAGWLVAHGGKGRFLRQIDVPGVDTKLVEQHRSVLAGLLDVVLPAERIDAGQSRGQGFAARYGFAEPVRLWRLRFATGFAGMPPPLTEAALRLDELARLSARPAVVVIVENEVTCQALPVPRNGVLVWGAGYAAGLLGRVPWLQAAPRVVYAGDLDSHGFAILSLLRGKVPQVESLLMDRETLVAHRDRWGAEPSPTRARLAHLTAAEDALYQDLVEDVFGSAVRLEQERIAWDWLLERLRAAAVAQ